MVSKQVINIIGLQINVFGLDEYRQLPEDIPLCAMFFCTGFKSKCLCEKTARYISNTANSVTRVYR
jgi:hypothetical protein